MNNAFLFKNTLIKIHLVATKIMYKQFVFIIINVQVNERIDDENN
jgi:hypothetical protein